MEIARHWRLNNQRYNIQGSVCSNCEKTQFPPRVVCSDCNDNNREITLTTDSATVYEATVIKKPIDSSEV